MQRRFVAVSPVNPIRPLSISLSLSLLSIQLHHAGRRLLDAAAKVAGTPDQWRIRPSPEARSKRRAACSMHSAIRLVGV